MALLPSASSSMAISSSTRMCPLLRPSPVEHHQQAWPCWTPARLLPADSRHTLARSSTPSSRARGRTLTAASARYHPYPFDERNYYRAHLYVITLESGGRAGASSGTLMLCQGGAAAEGATPEEVLVLGVGGDTLNAIYSHVNNQPFDRPMALDLLWQVLQRGQDVSKRDWRLVRVAVVDLCHSVYHGRLFFGDAQTGEVVWDCDCRPSDAIWLSMKANCPIYVNRRVWQQNAQPLADMLGALDPAVASAIRSTDRDDDDPASIDVLTKIRPDDPDPLVRLKREMAVALAEEDYAAAARLRDHPYMSLHLRILASRRAGQHEDARRLQQQLERQLRDNS